MAKQVIAVAVSPILEAIRINLLAPYSTNTMLFTLPT